MGFVYAIKNKSSGKMYIGSSIQPKKRETQHFSNLRNSRHPNNYLQNAFVKYGENDFEWVILEDSIKIEEDAVKARKTEEVCHRI